MKKLLFVLALLLVLLTIYLISQSFYKVKFLKGALPAILPPKEVPKSKIITSQLGLKLPEGFSIDIFAKDLKAPRVLLLDQNGTLIVSIPQEGKVVALPDKNNDGKADQQVILAQNLARPHGLALKDGKLYVAQVQNILSFDYDQNNLKATSPKSVISLPASGRHFTRTIAFGPNEKLYIAVGSTCDVCFEKDPRNGSMLVADVNTGQTSIFARGLRNSVFFIFHPENSQIWATEMGRDFLGDDLPPDEINIVEEDKDYGWPICYGKRSHDRQFDKKQYIRDPCEDSQPSLYDIAAHSAPLGLRFITSNQFPQDWQGGLLVAYHGSWNRSTPIGYKVVRLNVDGEKVQNEEDFITGFLVDSQTVGRPVDLIFDKNGLLYISDDKAGVIYQVKQSR